MALSLAGRGAAGGLPACDGAAGDYTGDRKLLHALGVSLGDTADKAKYAVVLPTLNKVKTDIDDAARFMTVQGHTPHFLGMVGGSIELPYYICDLHSKYTFWDRPSIMSPRILPMPPWACRTIIPVS